MSMPCQVVRTDPPMYRARGLFLSFHDNDKNKMVLVRGADNYCMTRWFLLLLQNLRLVPLAYLHPFSLRQVALPNLLHGDAFLRRA